MKATFTLALIFVAAAVAATRPGNWDFSKLGTAEWVDGDGEDIYNSTTAYQLVDYAAAAYCPKYELESWSCKACKGDTTGFVLTSYFLDEETSTNAYVGYHAGLQAIILSFEGSANTTNWITNIQFLRVDYDFPGAPPGVKVHRGFYNAYKKIGIDVEQDVGALVDQFPTYHVYVTGHSLGGALANFGAIDVSLNRPHVPVNLYTFGAPRIGNEAYAQWFDSQIENSIRMTNDSDIVPHLPPKTWPFSFFQTTTEVWLTPPNKVTVCSSTNGEDPKCSDGQIDLSSQDHHYYLDQVMGGGAC
eukprot:c19258_g1_i1.p2 GENE.c19258_g1_i1~~c19258_g1_i1.p2  ORF type:complete len:312 (+),score=71.52 c19258_g1_i1:31-936(+)